MTASPPPASHSSEETETRPRPGVEFDAFIDTHREALETLADAEYPISPVIAALLARADGGER